MGLIHSDLTSRESAADSTGDWQPPAAALWDIPSDSHQDTLPLFHFQLISGPSRDSSPGPVLHIDMANVFFPELDWDLRFSLSNPSLLLSLQRYLTSATVWKLSLSFSGISCESLLYLILSWCLLLGGPNWHTWTCIPKNTNQPLLLSEILEGKTLSGNTILREIQPLIQVSISSHSRLKRYF